MTITRIKQRRGTAAAWTAANPTLDSGEFGVETDTGKIKLGDGSTAWTALNYLLEDAALTGTPTAPTAAPGTDTTQVANTAFVKGAVDNATYAGPDDLPWTVQINPALSVAKVTTSFPTIGVSSGFPYIYNNGNQNSALVWDVVLAAGTWTIDIRSFTDANYGIMSVQLDDGGGVWTTLGNIDLYSASAVTNVAKSVTGVVVGSTIRRQLRLLMATKNASSSNYGVALQFVALRRTA